MNMNYKEVLLKKKNEKLRAKVKQQEQIIEGLQKELSYLEKRLKDRDANQEDA